MTHIQEPSRSSRLPRTVGFAGLALGVVVIALALLVWHPVSDGVEVPRVSGSMLFLIVGAIFIAISVADGFLRKHQVWQATKKTLVWGLVFFLGWWFVFGSGRAGVDQWFGRSAVTGSRDFDHITVPLKGPNQWVEVSNLPPVAYKIDQRDVRGILSIMFNDGSLGSLAPGEEKDFGETRYPAKFRAEGTAYIWFCPSGGCWRIPSNRG